MSTDARSLSTDVRSLGTDARSLGTDVFTAGTAAFTAGTASKTKTCPHCHGTAHSRLGAKGCEQGRAWLLTPAEMEATEKKKRKAKAKRLAQGKRQKNFNDLWSI